MNIKEAIEFLEDVRLGGSSCYKPDTHRDKILATEALLKRGEKYEKMWGELKKEHTEAKIRNTCPEGLIDRYLFIKEIEVIEQKYFPKPKETIDKSLLLDLARQMNESYINYIEAHLLRGMPIEPSHLHMFANGIIRNMERNMKND